MLVLIGAGISFDLTLKGIEILKKADEIFVETYTNIIEEDKILDLEKTLGKKITRIERIKVESNFLIQKAKEKKVCLLVSGDPLTATTHVSLLLDAKNQKVQAEVVSNSSIFTAVARTGLQIYRFGKTASLVNPKENYKPTSSLDVIRKNLENNAHTLVLLDTEPKAMDAKKALIMLKEFKIAIIMSRIGEQDEKISYGEIKKLIKQNLGKPPFAIAIPAKLHMIEEEYLEFYKL